MKSNTSPNIPKEAKTQFRGPYSIYYLTLAIKLATVGWDHAFDSSALEAQLNKEFTADIEISEIQQINGNILVKFSDSRLGEIESRNFLLLI